MGVLPRALVVLTLVGVVLARAASLPRYEGADGDLDHFERSLAAFAATLNGTGSLGAGVLQLATSIGDSTGVAATRRSRATPKTAKTPSDLLTKFGYPSEVYTVETEDGYQLRLDRIPNEGKPVVYLAHALQCSAAAYLILGPQRALALLLHDAGFDVWLGNFRGSKYSRTHRLLSDREDTFWDFSWHEHGMYDNPAFIDFILKATGKSDLIYIGHSMGTTSFLVTASSRPEYQQKIRAAFLLAPVASIAHNRSPFVTVFKKLFEGYELLFGSKRAKELKYSLYPKIANPLCHSLGSMLCYGALDLVVGRNPNADYWTAIPDLFDYVPAGGSNGEPLHYVQLSDKSRMAFRQYDYGKSVNKKLYGSKTPPDYPLGTIQTPIYTYNGASDILVDSTDLNWLKSQLPNVKKAYEAPDKTFNHVDFIFGGHAKAQVFDTLMEDIAQYAY